MGAAFEETLEFGGDGVDADFAGDGEGGELVAEEGLGLVVLIGEFAD